MLFFFTSQAEEKELWIGGELPNRDKAGWVLVGFSNGSQVHPVQLLRCRASFLITMGYTKNSVFFSVEMEDKIWKWTEFKSDTLKLTWHLNNGWLEDYFFGMVYFQGRDASFRGVYLYCCTRSIEYEEIGLNVRVLGSQKQEALPKLIGVRFFYDYYSGRNDLSHYL